MLKEGQCLTAEAGVDRLSGDLGGGKPLPVPVLTAAFAGQVLTRTGA